MQTHMLARQVPGSKSNMEAVVRRVLTVVEDSLRHSNTTDLNEVDRISLALERSTAELGELLNAAIVSDEITLHEDAITVLRDLHICLNQMTVEWESKLQIMSTGDMYRPPTNPGRPRKLLNIPMVSCSFVTSIILFIIHMELLIINNTLQL